MNNISRKTHARIFACFLKFLLSHLLLAFSLFFICFCLVATKRIANKISYWSMFFFSVLRDNRADKKVHLSTENKPKHNLKLQCLPVVFFFQRSTLWLNLCVNILHLNVFQILPGNNDPSTIVSHHLNPPIFASQVRVVPHSFHRRTVCMRMELRGCPSDSEYTAPLCSIFCSTFTSSHTCHACVQSLFSGRKETLCNLLSSISRRKKSCFPTLSGEMTSKVGRKAAASSSAVGDDWYWLCVARSNPPVLSLTFGERGKSAFRSFHYSGTLLILRVCIWADKFRSSARTPTQRRNDLIKFSACSQHFMPSHYTLHVLRSLYSVPRRGARRWTSMYSLSYYCVWVFERVARSQKAARIGNTFHVRILASSRNFARKFLYLPSALSKYLYVWGALILLPNSFFLLFSSEKVN
jgi:hypothetical protein